MEKLIKRIITALGTIIFLAVVVYTCFVSYKLYNLEKNQQDLIMNQQTQINTLTEDVKCLQQKMTQVVEYYEYQSKYSKDAYNYLAIGNSLTLIPSWGRGICSTEPDNDYFNLVVKRLEELNGKVVAHPINYADWERAANRDEAFELLHPHLHSELDLVTIQLGENAANTTTYEKDLESLVKHIKTIAPKVTIVMIGDFWDLNRNEMRKTAAKNTGIPFADLAEIVGNVKYQSVTGLECNLADGAKIVVSQAASTHPGDLGMEYIATKVCEALKINK